MKERFGFPMSFITLRQLEIQNCVLDFHHDPVALPLVWTTLFQRLPLLRLRLSSFVARLRLRIRDESGKLRLPQAGLGAVCCTRQVARCRPVRNDRTFHCRRFGQLPAQARSSTRKSRFRIFAAPFGEDSKHVERKLSASLAQA